MTSDVFLARNIAPLVSLSSVFFCLLTIPSLSMMTRAHLARASSVAGPGHLSGSRSTLRAFDDVNSSYLNILCLNFHLHLEFYYPAVTLHKH